MFSPKGEEIVKRQGYIEPHQMGAMLKAIIKDPSPAPSVQPERTLSFPSDAQLSAELRRDLNERFLAAYDTKLGSWGFEQKFLDWNGVEYSMMLARTGDTQAEHMARQTLD